MTSFSSLKAQSFTGDKESARVFVQKFYDWYNVLYNKPTGKNETCACIIALKTKSEYFDAALSKAIIEDNNAQAKADEIVGLESDPFLAAQDNGFVYQTGNVKQEGNKFFVDVHVDLAGKSRAEVLKQFIAVIPEVVKINGHWQFINFTYPPPDGNGSNLVDILKSLKSDRAKWAAEAKNKKKKQ